MIRINFKIKIVLLLHYNKYNDNIKYFEDF